MKVLKVVIDVKITVSEMESHGEMAEVAQALAETEDDLQLIYSSAGALMKEASASFTGDFPMGVNFLLLHPGRNG